MSDESHGTCGTPHLLQMWTVFHNPTDYPGKFVVRRFLVTAGGGIVPDAIPCGIADTLEGVRTFVPRGRVAIARYPDDNGSIVETWL